MFTDNVQIFGSKKQLNFVFPLEMVASDLPCTLSHSYTS